MSTSALGPCLTATITSHNIDACAEAWCEYLHQAIDREEAISAAQAEQWGHPALAGSRVLWLRNAEGEAWLRLIEDSSVATVDPFRHTGWLSLEINVQDVDSLHRDLIDSPFRILGHPADLDISPDIRAMQVMGPAGEVLYLTQIKREVPGFDLPLARSAVDRLFIPVLLANSRDAALETYEQFPDTSGSRFETRITVINRAHGLTLETRHPVATVQLQGKSLIEIDEYPGLAPRPAGNTGLASGISMIGFAVEPACLASEAAGDYTLDAGPFAGGTARLLQGSAGELVELIDRESATGRL